MKDMLEVSQDVTCSLNHNGPVVALESSVIANGLPSYKAVEAAEKMQAAVRDAGAVPAIIGLIDGVIKVGLSDEEIGRLADGSAVKVASRDLAWAIKCKQSGGTTVSATARLAAAAGISVMATGGIGGVHRGCAADISADLWELTRVGTIVVCSGPKAVLDVPATAEWLETHSINVYGYQTDTLPAFYCGDSGLPVQRVEDAADFGAMVKLLRGSLGVRTGIVLTVQPPQPIEISADIEKAVAEAEAQSIRGKDLTPFLLSKVAELTGGRSIEANIALLANNARVAALVAAELLREDQRRIGFMA